MDKYIDLILLGIGGAFIGGFIAVKLESFLINKIAGTDEPSEAEKFYALKKVNTIEMFLGALIIAMCYMTVQNVFLYGIGAGLFIFSIKPNDPPQE